MNTTGIAILLCGLATPTLLASPSSRGIDRTEVTSVRHIASRTIENRELPSFEKIRLEGIADLFLTQDSKQSVQVDAEEGKAEHILTSVENGTLVIRNDNSFHNTQGVKVYVSIPVIKALESQGTGSVIGLTPINGGELTISSEGTGEVELSINATKLSGSLSGTGNMSLTGNAENVKFEDNGTGDIHARKLVASSAQVASSGTGDVELTAQKTLSVQLSGTGDVRYGGTVTQVNSQVSGTGTVRKLPNG